MITGMVIGFWGEDPPPGWLWCDGSNIPDGEVFAALRTLLGCDRLPKVTLPLDPSGGRQGITRIGSGEGKPALHCIIKV